MDSPAQAFVRSLEQFLATGTKDELEDDLKTLGEGPDFLPDSYKDQTEEQTAYKSSVLEIILKHRLCNICQHFSAPLLTIDTSSP